jgi:hypothetical protein
MVIAFGNSAFALSEEYFIVSDGDTILVGEDIESYSRTNHRLMLTEVGLEKWASYENQPPPEGRTLVERTLLTDRRFTIVYAGDVVAEGYICSGTDSSLQSGLNLFDALMPGKRSRLGFLYCRFEPGMPPDPLESEAFGAYFEIHGKLID